MIRRGENSMLEGQVMQRQKCWRLWELTSFISSNRTETVPLNVDTATGEVGVMQDKDSNNLPSPILPSQNRPDLTISFQSARIAYLDGHEQCLPRQQDWKTRSTTVRDTSPT